MRGNDLIRAAPGKDASRELELIRESKAPPQTAAAVWRNGSFVFHMAWRMTASFRATATLAFLNPAPLAIRRPQAFREEKAICRVRMTLAAHRGGFA